MRKTTRAAIALSTCAIALASCGANQAGDSQEAQGEAAADSAQPFATAEHGTFDQPWSLAIEPGTNRFFITEKEGAVKWYDPANGTAGDVTGVPEVDYGGQGGLGEIAFAPDYQTSRQVYLTWAEAGEDDTRGAAMGRGTLNCADGGDCAVEGLEVIWRQAPKVTGRGHYSHRIAFSPDGQYLFLSSGDRQKMDPAQDLSTNLGKVLRLNLDGTPATGNPFADQGGVAPEVWSYGHRNLLGLQFDSAGQLWDLEHGPRGGDELNKVQERANYGWPVVANGDHYDGEAIPRHNTQPQFATPAISWNPVIAPGDFIFYRGDLWPQWQGQALIAGLGSQGIVRVSIAGETATEEARYPLGARIRDIIEAADGSLWIVEDGPRGRLLRLTPS